MLDDLRPAAVLVCCAVVLFILGRLVRKK